MSQDSKQIASKVPKAKLHNGHSIPVVGLGTWKSPQNEVQDAVRASIEHGYRHIDCAAIYGNENQIGATFEECFKEGLVKREELFITSKLWNTNHNPDHVKGACQKTLKDLHLDYLDLYLMHFPMAFQFTGYDLQEGVPREDNGFPKLEMVSVLKTWEAMEKLVDEGLVKSIGISNFSCAQIADLCASARIKPAVHQVELHPYLPQQSLVDIATRCGIHTTAYTPLGMTSDGKGPLHDPVIEELAKKHNKSPAQIVLRWGVQRGTSVIPKSTHANRLKENLDVINFELSDDDMKAIASIKHRKRSMCTKQYWGWEFFSEAD